MFVQFSGLADSLTLAGPAPPEVRAEISGTGKAVIALRLNRPPLVVSLARVGIGQFERSVRAADLPLTRGLEVDRLIGPRMITLEVDRKLRRRLPVSARLEWAPPSAGRPVGVTLEPLSVAVIGPARIVSRLDSIALAAVRVDGRRDTVRAEVGPGSLPERCTMDPPAVRVTVVVPRGRS